MVCFSLLYGKFREVYASLNADLKEKFNYLVAGFLATVVSIGTYNIFRFFIEDYKICTVLSWICAVLFAYVTNRKYVFNSKSKRIVKEFFSFIASRLFTLGVELLCMYLLVQVFSINDRISKVIVQVIVIVLNYILSKLFVFKKKD